MNFGDLKQLVTASLGREPAADVYKMVTADINASLMASEMIRDAVIPVTDEETGGVLPSDYLAANAVSWLSAGVEFALDMAPIHSVIARRTVRGIPEVAGIDGDRIELAPLPSTGGEIRLSYYAALPDLEADTDTNFVLEQYPAVYVYGALTHHGRLIGDPMADGWQAQYAAELALAKVSDRAGAVGAGPFRVIPEGPVI